MNIDALSAVALYGDLAFADEKRLGNLGRDGLVYQALRAHQAYLDFDADGRGRPAPGDFVPHPVADQGGLTGLAHHLVDVSSP